MLSPAEGSAVIDGVLDVETRATVDQQADDGFMASQGGVVERSGMGMQTLRVIAAGIYAGIEEETHDIGVAELSGEGEGAMPAFSVGRWEEFRCIGKTSQAGGGGNVRDLRTAPHKGSGGAG